MKTAENGSKDTFGFICIFRVFPQNFTFCRSEVVLDDTYVIICVQMRFW